MIIVRSYRKCKVIVNVWLTASSFISFTVYLQNLPHVYVFDNVCSFPREWIKGSGYPDGIDRNTQLSKRDKEHVKRLYGPSRLSGVPSG